jgi:hypothetical protein
MKRYLTPFTGEGRMLRGDLGGKGPASFKYLLGIGALSKDERGLLALFTLGGSRYFPSDQGANDRPGGGFPEFRGSSMSYYPESTYEYLEKAQGFLIKFGVLMAEEGLLED